jgi:hypothetical protein
VGGCRYDRGMPDVGPCQGDTSFFRMDGFYSINRTYQFLDWGILAGLGLSGGS